MTIYNPFTPIIQRVLFTFILVSPAVSWSQTAIVDAGKLAGFDGVTVNGMEYNVRFVDGSFNSIFGTPSMLDFTTYSSALAAANELLTAMQGHPIYDISPELTFGCNNIRFCNMYIPLDDSAGIISSVQLLNQWSFLPDSVGIISLSRESDDYAVNEAKVYTDWSIITTPVPVPAAIWLMGTGLLGLFGYSRRKVQ